AERAALDARIAAQRATERGEADGLLARLGALRGARRDADARTALADRLASDAFDASHVASFDPISLRLLAIEIARREAELAALDTELGPAHPRRIRAEAALDDAKAELHRTAALCASSLRAGVVTDVDTREDRARELTDEIVLLSLRIDRPD